MDETEKSKTYRGAFNSALSNQTTFSQTQAGATVPSSGHISVGVSWT
jgi:hypothetical protein